jgi:hypothetical protein
MLILLLRRPRPFCCLLNVDDVLRMAVATTSLKMMMIDD